MPGAGKSTVGRLLARRLSAVFVDIDALIEAQISRSIRQFFEDEGEDRFRDLEANILQSQVELGAKAVVATGGGIVLRGGNRRLLNASTSCVYLRSTPSELLRRLRHDKKRPLLQVEDPRARIAELYVQRDPLYRQTAHFVVESRQPSAASLTDIVLMQLELAGVLDPFKSSDSPSLRSNEHGD